MKALVTSIAFVAALAPALPLAAQVTTPPPLGRAPALTIPPLQRAVLPNGLTVIVARNAEVPVVEGRLVIDGGARIAGAPAGLATFAASLLTEGAAGRSALPLAEDIAFLGASSMRVRGWENFTISVRAPKRTFDQALAIGADVALRPELSHRPDVKRPRPAPRLVPAGQGSAGAVAQRVFFAQCLPSTHPLHLSITVILRRPHRSIGTVRAFWHRAANPAKATLVLTGDVTLAEATAWARTHFGSWRAPAMPARKAPSASIAAAPRRATRVILVDKPDAAQSVIMIGAPGVARTSPDYAAITLMNTIMGGSFSSRLNDLLREQLGYSYGAGSSFNWSPVAGPFIANSQVRTNVTDSSLAVFFRDSRRCARSRHGPKELTRGRNYLVLGALGDYETAGDIAGAITQSLLFNQPVSAVAAELRAINAVTAAQVRAAAQRHLDPGRLTVVVVGDIAKIRPGIEGLNLGPIKVQTF